MSELEDFVVEDGVLNKYVGPGGDVVVPDGVKRINFFAFIDSTGLTSVEIPSSVTDILTTFRDCSALNAFQVSPENTAYTSVDGVLYSKDMRYLIKVPPARKGTYTIPDGVKMVGAFAFADCIGLTRIDIPFSVTDIGDAFKGCTALNAVQISPENTVYTSVDGVLYSKDMRELIKFPYARKGPYMVPDDIKKVCIGAFRDCTALTEVVLPDGLTQIGMGAFSGCTALENIYYNGDGVKLEASAMNEDNPVTDAFAAGFVRNCAKWEQYIPFSNSMLVKVLSYHDTWGKLPPAVQAEMFLTWQGKALLPIYKRQTKDAQSLGEHLLERMTGKVPAKICSTAAVFLDLFVNDLSDSIIRSLYETLKPIKAAAKAVKTIEDNEIIMQRLNGAAPIPEDLPEAERWIMEKLRAKGVSMKELTAHFEQFYSKIELPEVCYCNGEKVNPAVLCWLLTAHEEMTAENRFQVRIQSPGVLPEAEEILTLLDPASFQSALLNLADKNLGLSGKSKKMYLAYPICRYADEKLFEELTRRAPHWSSSISGIEAPPLRTFRNACIYSQHRAAMLFADKYHDLDAYAKLRSTDEDTIRDLYLSDVGINEQGEKSYDLGNQTVVARLQPDLSFRVVTQAGKTMKSLPKKDADPEKYAAANTDFSEMKKAAKKIVKNRSAVLFEDFLSGRTRKSEDWQKAYLNNPLLRSVAKLIVWKQGNRTFTLTDDRAVFADGMDSELNHEAIAVAHPMEMAREDVSAWQKYFTSHGLKQPFAQIWEPVIDLAGIQKNRYEGCMIPYYRFCGMEKHGIIVDDYDYHDDIEISFAGCIAQVERIDSHWHEIANNDRFEVKNFSFQKYTRQVNHIVGYLDRITIYDRIRNDDTSIELLLPNFTLAQITEFIKIATENNCTNVTVLLLNYKNEHFADFDPMEEFLLE